MTNIMVPTTLSKKQINAVKRLIPLIQDPQFANLNQFVNYVLMQLGAVKEISFSNPQGSDQWKTAGCIIHEEIGCQPQSINSEIKQNLTYDLTVPEMVADPTLYSDLVEILKQNSFWHLDRILDYLFMKLLTGAGPTVQFTYDDDLDATLSIPCALMVRHQLVKLAESSEQKGRGEHLGPY